MPNRTYVILDDDDQRRSEVYRTFAAQRPTIPVDSVEGLGSAWPEDVWFVIHDDDALLAALQKEFARRGCYHPIIAYREKLVPSRIVSAIHNGAVDYVLWPNSVSTFEQSEGKVTDLARRRCEEAAARIVAQSQMALLTPREMEILRHVRLGKTNKQIARDLAISPRTVEVHRGNAFAKLGARNSADATRILYQAEDGMAPLYKAA